MSTKKSLEKIARVTILGVALATVGYGHFAQAADPILSSDGYTKGGAASNPFDQWGASWYECTRYAWGRAFEKTGKQVAFSVSEKRHGGKWYDIVVGLSKGSEPQPNSLVSWRGTDGVGHVAYVEEVNGDYVTISESNMKLDGRYNGTKTITKSAMKTRLANFAGYIYLGSVNIKDFWRKADPLYTGQKNGFDAQFKLVNSSGKTVNLESVYLALHDANNNFVKDMKGFSNVSIGSGQTWQTGIVYTDTPSSAGTYRVVAKIDENFNGKWDGRTIGEETFTLKAPPIGINPPKPIPSSLKVSCPSTVNENSNNAGICSSVAYYSNGTSKTVTPSWADNSNALSINSSGTISTTNVTTNTNVSVTGSYTENGKIVQGTSNIVIKDSPIPPALPKVTSVSPLTVTYGRSTTFTITGSNLPSTLAAWIDQCVGSTAPTLYTSGNSTTRTFTCTPSYSKGMKSGVVKDKAGGTTLHSFNVTVR